MSLSECCRKIIVHDCLALRHKTVDLLQSGYPINDTDSCAKCHNPLYSSSRMNLCFERIEHFFFFVFRFDEQCTDFGFLLLTCLSCKMCWFKFSMWFLLFVVREREKKKPSNFSRMFVVFAQQVPYLQLDKSPIAEWNTNKMISLFFIFRPCVDFVFDFIFFLLFLFFN